MEMTVTPELTRLLKVLEPTLKSFKDPFLTRIVENIAGGTVPIGKPLGNDVWYAIRNGSRRALKELVDVNSPLISEHDLHSGNEVLDTTGWYLEEEIEGLPDDQADGTPAYVRCPDPSKVIGKHKYDE